MNSRRTWVTWRFLYFFSLSCSDWLVVWMLLILSSVHMNSICSQFINFIIRDARCPYWRSEVAIPSFLSFVTVVRKLCFVISSTQKRKTRTKWKYTYSYPWCVWEGKCNRWNISAFVTVSKSITDFWHPNGIVSWWSILMIFHLSLFVVRAL